MGVLAGLLAIGIMLALLAVTVLLTLIILWLAGWSERKWQRRRRGGSDSDWRRGAALDSRNLYVLLMIAWRMGCAS